MGSTPHPLCDIVETSLIVGASLFAHWLYLGIVDGKTGILGSILVVAIPHIQTSLQTIYTRQIRKYAITCFCQVLDILLSLVQVVLNKLLHLCVGSTRVVKGVSLIHLCCYNRHCKSADVITIGIDIACLVVRQELVHTGKVNIAQCTESQACAKITQLLIGGIVWIDSTNHIVDGQDKAIIIGTDVLSEYIAITLILVLCPIVKMMGIVLGRLQEVACHQVTYIHDSTITKWEVPATIYYRFIYLIKICRHRHQERF